MRKIIIAGLAMLTVLAAVLAAVLGSPANPVKASAVTVNAAAAARVSAATAASTRTSPSPLVVNLAGVSCVSVNFCAAVGTQAASARAHYVPVSMIWNGARWRKTAVSLPKGWLAGYLRGVSCTSAAYCVAVGQYSKSDSATIPVAVTWNGRAWTAKALPSLAGGRAFADGISCAAARHCAVAFDSNPMPRTGQAFIDVLTAAKWTVHALTPPKGSEFAAFDAVSCVSVTHCVIAGFVDDRIGERNCPRRGTAGHSRR